MTYIGFKRASQKAKIQDEAKGRSPPGFPPRSPDFVLQLAFGPKWLDMNFGLKPLKPGGPTLEDVFFPLFCWFFEMPLCHFYIFVAFHSLGVKLVSLLDSWMVYRSGNG